MIRLNPLYTPVTVRVYGAHMAQLRALTSVPVIGPRFFLRVWCRGAAAPTPEQTSDTAGDGFSKIQQAGVRSALAPRMALAQGRTGSRGAHSATRRRAIWSQTMRARSQHGSRRLGRRSFPIMFFRRALKHLSPALHDEVTTTQPQNRPRGPAPALLTGAAEKLCGCAGPPQRSRVCSTRCSISVCRRRHAYIRRVYIEYR